MNGAGGSGSGSTGGTGDNGTTAAGANGTEWSTTPAYGSGGGGAGGSGAGGTYGAGGGGGAEGSSGAGGAGTQGIIVITYTPTASSPPAVSNVVLNGNANFIPSPATTKAISVVASTTAGSNPIAYATSTIYRSGVSGGAGCAANNLDCYQVSSSSCVFSGSTTTVTCTANIYYFADATDASSSYSGQTWDAAVTVTDSGSQTNTSSTAPGITLQTLLAINITTSSINYGTVTASTTAGGNITTTVQDAGNCSTTLQLSGTALINGSNLIATSSQHYATSSFTYGGSEQQLNGSPTTVSGFLLTGPTRTAAVQSDVFWGIGVPAGSPTGTYNGTTTFTAIFSS